MQALHKLALEPVAEMTTDHNSFGFRPERCTADAIAQLFLALAQKGAAHWVLEGDIKSCFDKISHEWMLQNICTDIRMLAQWLKAGFIEEGKLLSTALKIRISRHGNASGACAASNRPDMPSGSCRASV